MVAAEVAEDNNDKRESNIAMVTAAIDYSNSDSGSGDNDEIAAVMTAMVAKK
jgi:hypothetical protein